MITETISTELKPKILVKLVTDEDMSDPSDDDAQWTLISFGRKHSSHQDPDKFFTPQYDENGRFTGVTANQIGLRRKLQVGTAFILSYFEHGNCVWSLQGTGPQCRFDSVDIAGLLIWEHKPNVMGAKTYDDRAKDAAGFLTNYTDWCNGNGMGYSVEFIEPSDTVDEYGEEIEVSDLNGEEETSCYGYYGSDSNYVYSEVKDSVAYVLAKRGLKLADVDIVIGGDRGDYVSDTEVTPTAEQVAELTITLHTQQHRLRAMQASE